MRHPALIVTPMFSFWTFGPTIRCSCGQCYCSAFKVGHKIQISAKLTWLNIVISFAGVAGFCWVLDLHPHNRPIPFYIMIPSVVLVILIQTLDYCKSCCCRACITHCYPVTKLTTLDPTTMETQVNRDIIIDNQFNQQNIVFRDVLISDCDVLF